MTRNRISTPARPLSTSRCRRPTQRSATGMLGPMSTSTPAPVPSSDNSVFLRGRLAATPVIRLLPSGDPLCSFRLTVRRPPGDRARVDSLDCATTVARVRHSLERAVPGDELEVRGSLHRRFWRSSTGPASRYEVAVTRVKSMSRRRSGA
jgi:single-strand DNA-binding protein